MGDSVRCKKVVLFADLRGFTNLSESIHIEALFSFLNQYLTLMEPIIQSRKGFIDKFIGDAIMAIFDDELNACEACLEMISVSKTLVLPNGNPLLMGIGLHSGDLILGTVGSPSRLDTTVIGDTVNLASRIENANKTYGTKILLSESVLNNLPSNQFVIREIDKVKVKGKEIAIGVFELLGQNNK